MTMEITYERGINGTYMVVPGQKESTVGYARRMILENQIRGFLPMTQRCQEEGECYEYKVSALISLAEYLEHKPLRAPMLKQWVFALCRVVAELEEYLLTEEYLWLSPETIFLRGSETEPFQGEISFCLYPDVRQDAKEKLRQMIKYMMERTDPTEEDCARMCYELYGLAQKDNFCLKEYMDALERWAQCPAQDQAGKKKEKIKEKTKEKTKGKTKEKKKRQNQPFAVGRNSGIIKQ